MKGKTNIRYLFMDIGSVLLTDGWVHEYRKLAAKKFNLNLEELEKRHNQAFDTYEEGKLTIAEYLSRIVFYEKRSFAPSRFRNFMFACIAQSLGIKSIPHTDYKSTYSKLASFGLEAD